MGGGSRIFKGVKTTATTTLYHFIPKRLDCYNRKAYLYVSTVLYIMPHI